MSSGLVLCAAGLAAIGALTDMSSGKIPNWLTGSGAAAGLLLHWEAQGWRGLRSGIEGALIAGGLFFVMFLLGGMGAGDVKLMAVLGLWVGDGLAWSLAVTTALAGGILAVGYTFFRRQTRVTIANLTELMSYHLLNGLRPHPDLNLQASPSIRLPYGVAIAVGMFYTTIQNVWR